MATAHSSTGIRSLRSGAISLARAGAISAIGVVQITSTEEATRTSPSAVARRKTMSPAQPATVEFIAAPIAMSPKTTTGPRDRAQRDAGDQRGDHHHRRHQTESGPAR